MSEWIERYFLSFDGVEGSEKEVTKEQFMKAERAAGFHSKFGDNHVATGGFGAGGIRGRVEYTCSQPDNNSFNPTA